MADIGKWALWLGLGLGGLVVAGLIGAVAIEVWLEHRDATRFPPPGRMVDVGNGRRHMLCVGQGGPTVVLVSGGGVPAVLLAPLQTRIARFARVCAYDRAGLGWSEPSRSPLSIAGQAAELRAVLAGAGETGPFVLVGHSYGGLIARQMARDQPGAVAGMVLVDAAEEGVVFNQRFFDWVSSGAAFYRRLEGAAKLGLVRAQLAADPAKARLPASLDPAQRRQALALVVRPAFFRAAGNEAAHGYDLTPEDQRRPGGFGALGSMPLMIVRHGRPFTGPDAFLEPGWAAGQARLAALSTDSETLVAQGSGHDIPGTGPDLAAAAIAKVVIALREKRPLRR
ncbi:pimeloyl-ACP methyl ester carboxylesterase [Caulobacter ginsengisoli]|uniref:Pimeloyl-ACP methyl ester carboxylesterase n=1 Tax=Caulobacter ginsengisoli TaxID=400775 RepID=A0ABU0INZ9_9CAUL|nr:alpha/beta hydrolase [Caulobacter ginsengisoli]MDQ0463719.1 pimeloyl-ACP methyl ester carboxylesterase [Caulobacter ginsengisoli]